MPKLWAGIKEAPGYRQQVWGQQVGSQLSQHLIRKSTHTPVAWDCSPNPCPVAAADLPEGSRQGDKVQHHTPFS